MGASGRSGWRRASRWMGQVCRDQAYQLLLGLPGPVGGEPAHDQVQLPHLEG
jgi:hypothetical protein